MIIMANLNCPWSLLQVHTKFNYDVNGRSETVIGRNKQANIICYDIFASQHQASIFYENGKIYICDKSRNGTFINKQRITKNEKILLKHNDIICFGCPTIDLLKESQKTLLYQVINKNLPASDIIELSDSDSEPNIAKDCKTTNSNKKQHTENHAVTPISEDNNVGDDSDEDFQKFIQDLEKDILFVEKPESNNSTQNSSTCITTNNNDITKSMKQELMDNYNENSNATLSPPKSVDKDTDVQEVDSNEKSNNPIIKSANSVSNANEEKEIPLEVIKKEYPEVFKIPQPIVIKTESTNTSKENMVQNASSTCNIKEEIIEIDINEKEYKYEDNIELHIKNEISKEVNIKEEVLRCASHDLSDSVVIISDDDEDQELNNLMDVVEENIKKHKQEKINDEDVDDALIFSQQDFSCLQDSEKEMLKKEFEELNIQLKVKSNEELMEKPQSSFKVNKSFDEGFPCSQFFNDPIDSITPPTASPNEDTNTTFSWIKQELETIDFIQERHYDLVDSDEEQDEETNLLKVFESQLFNASAESTTKENHNSGKDNAGEAINEKEKLMEVEVDKCSKLSQENSKEIINAIEASSSKTLEQVTDQSLSSKDPNFFYGKQQKPEKSKYVKPPIIEAPKMKLGRRRGLSTENLEKETVPKKKPKQTPPKETKRTKKTTASKKSPVFCKTGWVNKSKGKSDITKEEKRIIKEKRMEILRKQSTESKQNESGKNIEDQDDSSSKEKDKAKKSNLPVKMSHARGDFLLAGTSSTVVKGNPKTKGSIPEVPVNKSKPKSKVNRHDSSNRSNSIENQATSVNNNKKGNNKNVSNKATSKDSGVKSIGSTNSNASICRKSIDSYVIETVLKWQPIWLEETKNDILDELLLSSNCTKPERMLHRFANFDDYFNNVVPLLFLDSWSSIINDWRTKDIDKRKQVMVITAEKENKTTRSFYLYCKSFITRNQHNDCIHPRVGDIIIIELLTESMTYPKVFGYVEHIHKKKLTKQDHIQCNIIGGYSNKDFVATEITFIVRTKPHNEKILFHREMRMRVVSYFYQHLRIFNAVANLENSALGKIILNPDINHFIIKENINNKLHLKSALNDAQKQAVLEAAHICCRPKPGIYMLQGPPGTGKSKVIASIMQQVIFSPKEEVILVVAPSNGTTDEIAIKMLDIRKKMGDEEDKIKMVRVGVAQSINKKAISISLDELAKRHVKAQNKNSLSESKKKDFNFRKEKIQNLLQQEADLKREGKNCEEIKKKINKERQELEKIYSVLFNTKESSRELQKAKELVLNKANIICTTLSSCLSPQMDHFFTKNFGKITCCIVDEATQSSESLTLIPLMLGIKKIVLVGDPQQLQATILSQRAKQLGLGNSLFSRLMHSLDHLPNNPIRFLNLQYRMHPEIAQFPSSCFYQNRLLNGVELKYRETSLQPYLVFNLSYEQDSNENYSNDLEAHFVVKLVEEVIAQCAAKYHYTIGIITPYVQQKETIKKKLSGVSKKCSVDVNTVDGFQGQERDIIVLSFVRRTPTSFLSDEQRINVALTRAKRALYICTDHLLLKKCPLLNKIYTNAVERKKLITVSETNFYDEKFIENVIRRT